MLIPEEVARLIDATANLMHRAMVMTLYATGVRKAELCRLKVADIENERVVLHIHEGRETRSRCPAEPEAARHPARALALDEAEDLPVPRKENNWRADVPVTTKVGWTAVNEAAKAAGITGHVSPHTLRQSDVTHLLGAGAALRTIQVLLGHSKLAAATVYLHLSRLSLRNCTRPRTRLAGNT